MKKIFYYSTYVDSHTGSPKALLDLVAGLEKERYLPVLLVPETGALPTDFKQMNGQVLYQKSLSLKKSNVVSYLKSIRKFQVLFKKQKVDLIHFNAVGWRESALVAARLNKIPSVLHLHNPYPENEIRQNFNFKLAQKIIIVSESMRRNFEQYPAILKKIQCIHNGVDLKRFVQGVGEFRKQLPVSKNGLVIGYVGQLCHRKGVDLLIRSAPEILRQFPDVLYVFAGADGIGEKGYTKSMKHLTSNLGISDRFIFLGKRDDIPEVMNACDILAVPSRAEPFGKVIIEAMACGKCVIATAVGGIPEIIQDGQNGLLVPADDVSALREAILKTLNDKKLRDTLAHNGNKTAMEKFSINALVDKTQTLYGTLLNDRG